LLDPCLGAIVVCILIVGRWFLPKGDLTREQLSTLLLVYIGMASDILEFAVEGISETVVRCDRVLVYTIMSIASLSMLQFALVLTANSDTKSEKTTNKCCSCKYPTEVRGILIASLMQDGPFLAVRLFLMIHYKAINQTMLFFTCKNILMLLLQCYRLIVMGCVDEPVTQSVKIAPSEDGTLQIIEIEEEENNHRTKLNAPRI
ncbi:transmembrane protein 26-like, partial [Ptychodera flava]|uniref:transmembrane protein 26-like n=1 Tax=Ptychodera flava TaxID=63121 RepID=UPI003969FF4C